MKTQEMISLTSFKSSGYSYELRLQTPQTPQTPQARYCQKSLEGAVGTKQEQQQQAGADVVLPTSVPFQVTVIFMMSNILPMTS